VTPPARRAPPGAYPPVVARWALEDLPDQTGRTVLVTGANRGLGLRSAEALAARGARVLMACRDPAKAAEAREQVAAAARGPAPEVVELDLADLASVRACAGKVAATVDRLDVLMNNAGVMAVPFSRTADGFELQLGTNHLGHFALTGLLLPVLRQARAPRVVTTSSNVHRAGRINWDDLVPPGPAAGTPAGERGYRRWPAYAQSKLANLLFAFELDRRAGQAGSDLVSVAAHPGYAATHLLAVGAEQSGRPGRRLTGMLKSGSLRVLAQSDAMGALPQLYAATARGVEGGEYFGPDRLFELRGHPQRVGSSAAARDPETARRLWQVSEDLTGVTYAWDDDR
jgi:NAD(P)-dependent dehydrogenase (short-subunit alcohol dehydrogenase family)